MQALNVEKNSFWRHPKIQMFSARKALLDGLHITDSDIWSIYLEKQLDEWKEAGEKEKGEVQTDRGAQVHQQGQD